jgi:lipopolysaccharide biosynthesis glycosyltransferase
MKNNTAIFCTADENYALYAVIALRSMGRFFNFPLYLITDKRRLNSEIINFLCQYNISTLHSRSFDLFYTKIPDWSPIMYAIFEGPELLPESVIMIANDRL